MSPWTLYAPTTRWDPSRVSRYGRRAGRWHHGIDLYAPLGEPVVAVAEGVVEAAVRAGTPGWARYGHTVLLVHVDGTRTLYAHLRDAPLVRPGQYVRAGALLGHVGSTAGTADDPDRHFASAAPHLHFETLIGPYPASAGPDGDQRGSRSVDPVVWFAQRGARLTPALRPSRLWAWLGAAAGFLSLAWWWTRR